MKFETFGNEFVKAVSSVSYIIPSRSTLPILGDILFELRGNTLKLLSSDLEIFVRTSIEVRGKEDGEIAIPSKDLLNLIRSLSSYVEVTENVPGLKPNMVSNDLQNSDLWRDKFRCDFSKEKITLKGYITTEEKANIIDLAADKFLEESIENLYQKFEEFMSLSKIQFQTTETNKINIKTKTGKFSLSGESAVDFPEIEEKEELKLLDLTGLDLNRYLRKIIHASSTEDTRRNMTGILMDIRPNDLRFVATDGFRLAKIIRENFKHSIPKEEKIIIPKKTCLTIIRMLRKDDVKFEFDSSMIKISFDNTEIYSKLIDESFPNYETVIPKENDKKLRVNTREFLSTIDRIRNLSDETTHRIKFEIKNKELTVRADNPEKGSEGSETLDCDFVRTDSEEYDFDKDVYNVAFNAKYLLECLRQMETEELFMSFSTPAKASIATQTTNLKDEDYMELIMPVRVS
ncbi:MAG TPA: DNA polymerase III subunit beta [Ignavibacteria bacterium]